MKVLISAYACEPNRGAEPGVGWNIVRELSAHHEIWVLTRSDNRPAIESYAGAWAKQVHWIYLDPPVWLTFWKRGAKGLRFFYLMWQRSALKQARRLSGEVSFDIVHHLTFGTYLVPSLLVKLGVPFIMGPVGGGEATPPLLHAGYSPRGKWMEFGRDFMREMIRVFPSQRRNLRRASCLIAATEQTRVVLEGFGLKEIRVLPQSGIGGDEVGSYVRSAPGADPSRSGIKLLVASRLIHWKAVDLAVEAVAAARDRGLEVSLDIIQRGPEEGRLKALVDKLGVSDRVRFVGHLPKLEDVYEAMTRADALIHPALHEVFGQVCVEALALGVPVICLDWCGPGMIVDESCGFKVTPGSRAETIDGFVGAIARLAAMTPDERDALSKAARRRATESFHWSKLAGEIEKLYVKAVGPGRNGSHDEP